MEGAYGLHIFDRKRGSRGTIARQTSYRAYCQVPEIEIGLLPVELDGNDSFEKTALQMSFAGPKIKHQPKVDIRRLLCHGEALCTPCGQRLNLLHNNRSVVSLVSDCSSASVFVFMDDACISRSTYNSTPYASDLETALTCSRSIAKLHVCRKTCEEKERRREVHHSPICRAVPSRHT